MNIIIVGCSQVGETLASELVLEDNNITMIDLSADKINNITSRYDVMGIVGNGATHKTQLDAGIDTADLFIAVTNSDELNLLCCMIARKEGKCKTIARVKNPEYSADAPYLQAQLGLAMVINPEYAAAEEISRILRFPSALSVQPFAKGKVNLVKFKLPKDCKLIGLSVREIAIKFKLEVLLCTVERGDEAYIAKGDFVFEEKDVVSIIGTPAKAKEFFEKIMIHYY